MNTLPEHSCDVLIIGSGAAGLSLALRLADQHQVIVLSKGPVTEGSTFYAQGGIAAVFDETDSIDSHVEDTLIAGNHFPVSLRFSENWSFIRTQEYMYEDLQRPTLYCFID